MADTVTFLIDPPLDLAPIEEWRAYLADLIEMNTETPTDQLAKAIKEAEDHIASLR